MRASRIPGVRPHRVTRHVADHVGHHDRVLPVLVQIAIRLAVERIGGRVVNHLGQVQHLAGIVDPVLLLRLVIERHVVDGVVYRVHVDGSRESHPYARRSLETV